MDEKISQHYHCQICGKAIPLSETLCSEECKQKYQKILKKRKLTFYFLYALIIGFFVVWLYLNR